MEDRIDMAPFIDALQPDEAPFVTMLNDPNWTKSVARPYQPPSRWRQFRGAVRLKVMDARTWVAQKIAPWLEDY